VLGIDVGMETNFDGGLGGCEEEVEVEGGGGGVGNGTASDDGKI
jgi:hypothetical protein